MSDCMPIDLAVEMMLLSPEIWPSLRNPQFDEDRSRSFISAISPSSLAKLFASYIPSGSVSSGNSQGPSPLTLSFVWIPLCKAVTNTNVLNEEPGCLLPCVAKLN